jgi:hypothetical protein
VTNEQDFDSMRLMETVQASFEYSDLENPMSERCKEPLRVKFDRKLTLNFH